MDTLEANKRHSLVRHQVLQPAQDPCRGNLSLINDELKLERDSDKRGFELNMIQRKLIVRGTTVHRVYLSADSDTIARKTCMMVVYACWARCHYVPTGSQWLQLEASRLCSFPGKEYREIFSFARTKSFKSYGACNCKK